MCSLLCVLRQIYVFFVSVRPDLEAATRRNLLTDHVESLQVEFSDLFNQLQVRFFGAA